MCCRGKEGAFSIGQIFSHFSAADLPECFNYEMLRLPQAAGSLSFVNMRNPAKTLHAAAN